MESVVKSGLSAVWLEDDARRVVPLLQTFCAERDAESTDLPGSIFIDDLYSPTNQQRIDLPELETVVGTRPFDRWPVIVTCGPPEFYERLERESSGGTLHLERWSLPLVEIQPPTTGGPAEADLFTAWYQERTGEQPQRGSAFDRDQGLMISMAYELRFEDPKTLKPFASRFRDRLKADDLDQKLVLPLALNRLYLLAPAEWLEEPDRERFEAINRENDFSILDLGGDREFLRLTHPHISDGIYRAIRDPATPRAFANDLAEAMRRAMASNVMTLRLLLRALSSADPRIAERLEDVDLGRLAELVTTDWKQSDVETRLRGSELADVSTSWACWHSMMPELRLEERLGHPLLAAARTALRNAGSAWTSNWQPLRAAYPGEMDLLADAVEWLHEPASERSQGWSFVWEEVWNQRGLSGLPFDERTLVLCARGWLERQWDQEDWHFVWTKLVNQPPSEPSDSNSAGIVELGWQWLTHEPSSVRRGVVPHDNLAAWAYVWQDLLKQQRFTSDPARSDLLKLGVAWLEGREDRREWAHVWQRLLESPRLPLGITRDQLLARGVAWLEGREDRGEWAHVWQQLLKSPSLPPGITRDQLLARGVAWLEGREDRSEWAFVWEQLLKSPSLPLGITRDHLLARGVAWLEGRDDRSEWAFVWQQLLKSPSLPPEIRRDELPARGVAWLEGREDRSEWAHVWEQLLELPSLPPGITRDELLACGVAWLEGREDRSEWAHVWQQLLKSPSLPTGITRDELLACGVAWLEGREDRSEWAHVWQRLLESPRLQPGVTRDELLACGVAWLEGREDRSEWAHVWERLVKSRKEMTAVQRDGLLRLGREWLMQPTHRPRPEWDKLLENWIDAGGDDGELLRAAADWIMQHRDEKQVPPFAAKVLRAAREPAAFDHIAQWLTEWGRAHPNAGQSKFVIGFLRTEQGKGWTPDSDMPGWKSLLAWLVPQSPPIHRADDASAVLLQQMQAAGQRVFGRITQRLPKGFRVELRQPEITAFLPGSQVDLHAPTDWDAFIGLESEFEIQSVSFGETGWRVVVSRRRVLEVERAARTEARLRELHAGDRVVGTVTRLVDYGAFIDLDGVGGLLHLNEMAWHRPTSPAGCCVVGQQLEVVVLSIDAPKRQVALGLKQLTPNPWEAIGPTLVVGSDIDGIVTNLVNFGAFIEVAPGVTGLLHMSNLSWAKRPRHPKECLEIGQQLRCRILRVDVEKQKLELGLKQLAANPWEERIPRQYLAGAWVDGQVTNLTDFGLFVELEPDLEGLLHLTDIPEDPADAKELPQHFSIGQTLRVRILRVDAVEQKIALSLKPSDT
jgi:predicted RNA-binding protein with RPS1 domain